MAKKTKTVNEPTPDENAPANAPVAEKGQNDRFVRCMVDGAPAPSLKADGTAKKLAPQAQVIADTLAEFGESGATRKELVAKLEADGKIVTRQPVGRILSYYQKDLQNCGVLTRTGAE